MVKIVEIKSFLIEEYDRIHGTWSAYKSFANADILTALNTCWDEYLLIIAENKSDKKYRVLVVPAENTT